MPPRSPSSHGTDLPLAPAGKKRKAEDDAEEPATKKTKEAAPATLDDEDAEALVGDDGEPEDEDEEAEDEDDEPAVKTKVVTGSEAKTAAVEADDEEYEKED